MSAEYIYLLPIGIAFFLAFNMGGSGTAPSFSALYGANLIRKEYIAGLFGIFVMLGALIAGGKVVETIGGAVLPAQEMSLVLVSIILLSSALSIFFANLVKVPQSTSQSTVFALAGCALYIDALQTDKLFLEIIPTWFVLPVLCFVLTLLCGLILRRLKSATRMPDFKSLRNHPIWTFITLGCSCYVAFSIGSNNVANAAGPLASMMVNDLNLGAAGNGVFVPLLCVLLVAPWFGIGSSVLGGRVLQTTGKDIVNIGPMGAALIAFITATLLLLASTIRGIPASLVQMNTFAIIALGLLKREGGHRVSGRIIARLVITWLVAPVVAFVIALALMAAAEWSGLL